MQSNWENIILGAMAILLLFWFQPGIKAALARSKQAESDWPSLLAPLGLVVLFVLFLIAMVWNERRTLPRIWRWRWCGATWEHEKWRSLWHGTRKIEPIKYCYILPSQPVRQSRFIWFYSLTATKFPPAESLDVIKEPVPDPSSLNSLMQRDAHTIKEGKQKQQKQISRPF